MIVVVALLGLALLLWAGMRLMTWQAAKLGASVPNGRRQPGRRHTGRRPAPGLPSLPPGHRPPPGLGPLSPSERFLSSEAARGLRELQQFLAERPA